MIFFRIFILQTELYNFRRKTKTQICTTKIETLIVSSIFAKLCADKTLIEYQTRILNSKLFLHFFNFSVARCATTDKQDSSFTNPFNVSSPKLKILNKLDRFEKFCVFSVHKELENEGESLVSPDWRMLL